MKVKDSVIEVYADQKELEKVTTEKKLRLPVGHPVRKRMSIVVICRELRVKRKFMIQSVKVLENHILLALRTR